MLKRIEKIKRTLKLIRDCNANCNMSFDEVLYVDNYLKQHPNKKYNWFLKKRLRAQYSLRCFKNGNE